MAAQNLRGIESPRGGGEARVTRRFDEPAERVFDAWLDEAGASRWLFATPTGTMMRATIDPTVGGTFLFLDRRGGEDVEHRGTYVVIERPRRLVFDFRVPGYSQALDRVTVEITGDGAGSVLSLTQTLRPEMAGMADRVRKGWSTMLEGLARQLRLA